MIQILNVIWLLIIFVITISFAINRFASIVKNVPLLVIALFVDTPYSVVLIVFTILMFLIRIFKHILNNNVVF